jgi:hypothetical protein
MFNLLLKKNCFVKEKMEKKKAVIKAAATRQKETK